MNRFGCPPVIHPFAFQPTRNGLQGFAATTGQGAAQGASAGAAVGSVVPLVGTAVGTILGAVGGAIASAFSRNDKEVGNFDQAVALWQVNPNNVYNIANKYLVLAGLFDLDLKNPHIPIYQHYGRMGEQKFVNDFVQQIYQAAQSGRITGSDTPQTIMNKVIQPWIDSWGLGPMVDPHADLINRLLVGMIADYVSGMQTQWHAVGGDYPFGNLPAFTMVGAAPAAGASPVSAVNPVGSPSVSSGNTLQHDTAGTIATSVGVFASLPGGAFTFTPPGGATQQIALTPAHTGGAGTLSITWNGAQAIATNSDGTTLAFNPANGSWVSYIGPVTPAPPPVSSTPLPASSSSTPPPVGTTVQSAPDMGQNGTVLQVPAGFIFVGTDPNNGAWVLQDQTHTNYVLWQGSLVPYTPGMFAPSTTTTPIASTTPIATTSAGQTVTQGDLQNLVAQLAAQGQTAQQAYTSALQSLQNSGVQVTPQVQSAVQSAVQSTPSPTTAGVSGGGWLGILGVVGVLFAMARPAKSPQRRRRKASR